MSLFINPLLVECCKKLFGALLNDIKL